MCFDTLERSIDRPATVVTAANGVERSGCRVDLWSRCSSHPPRCVVMVPKLSHTFRVARSAPTLVVHVLREDDAELAARFGAVDEDVDPFAGLPWSIGPGGAPVLDGLDWFAGTVGQILDVGDHVAVFIDVLTNVGSDRRAHETPLPARVEVPVAAVHAS